MIVLKLVTTPTRQKILVALKREGPLRVTELARLVNISPVGARQQLSSLLADGLVKVTYERQVVGRPVHIYELSEQGDSLFPRDYAQFTIRLLDLIADRQGMAYVEELLAAHVDKYASDLYPTMQSKSREERLVLLVENQTKRGYMVELESDGKRLNLIQNNCIHKDVACSFQALCRYETDCFSRLLQTEVDLRECIAHGDRVCRFEIRDFDRVVSV